MYTYTRRSSVSDLRSPGSGIKSEGVEVKADSEGKKVAVRSSEELAEIARGFTLDDFGGRSDALGG
jgi:hypothetical protein